LNLTGKFRMHNSQVTIHNNTTHRTSDL